MKKIIHICLCILLLFANITMVQAKEELKDDGKYHIVNVDKTGKIEVLQTFDQYAQAKVSYTLSKGRYSNLGITFGTVFVTVEYGVIAFDQAKDCSLNIEYTQDQTQAPGYTNGCYGADAAFLENNVGAGKVKFMLSGVTGWVDGNTVTIYPIEQVKKSSTYQVKDQYLYHNIPSNIKASAYANTIKLSKAPANLEENVTYYSYDGHYFYQDFTKMIDDYRSGSFQSSLNATQPFYNYFQYVSQRTTSAYDETDFLKYFKDTLAIHSSITSFYDKDNGIHDILTQSMLPNAIPAFLQYQNMYGANALLSISLAMNESATGRSSLAYARNNLFGHAAYDHDVEGNASRYQDVSSSVYMHDRTYISKTYTNPDAFQYYGGFLGDKNAGMNVKYASDPYWGEKAAQYALELDQAMGNKDQHRYALALTKNSKITVYEQAQSKSKELYTLPVGGTYSFIVLEKIQNEDGIWYRIQSDVALNEKRERVKDGSYSFDHSYGYLSSNDVQTIINQDKIKQNNYIPITFDANGGTFYPDQTSVTLQVENGGTPSITTPIKDHALFVKWDKELTQAKEATTYKAVYEDIKEISIAKKPQVNYAYGELFDVSKGMLTIISKDGSKKDIPMDQTMVYGYDHKKIGDQTLLVKYAGCETTLVVHVDKEQQQQKETLSSTADEIIKNYFDKADLTKEAKQQLEQFRNDIKQAPNNTLTTTQIRMLDQIFQKNLDPNISVVIHKNTHDFAVSGISFNIQEANLLHYLVSKTIVFDIKDTIPNDQEQLVKKVADGNHMHLDQMFSISGKEDFGGFQVEKDMIFSIKKPEKSENRQYKVYYIEGNNVIQLPTSQTKGRIQFNSEKTGSFALVSYTNPNLQEQEDIIENNTMENNGFNTIFWFIVFPCILLGIIVILGISLKIYLKKKGLRLRKIPRKPTIRR